MIPLSQQSKDKLARLYGTDVNAQLESMKLIPVHVEGSGCNKGAALAYKPQTLVERSALARLKIARNQGLHEKKFRRLVLRYLASIHELGTRPQRRKCSQGTQDLRRQVKRVHTAIRRLVGGESDLRSKAETPRLSSIHLAEAVRSLNFYLERLETELRSANAAHRPFRHAVSAQNLEILELVTFVRMVTGEPHWENLAILLKGATGDAGISRQRLFQLYKDRENRRERTLGLFRRARLRVEVGKLRLP